MELVAHRHSDLHILSLMNAQHSIYHEALHHLAIFMYLENTDVNRRIILNEPYSIPICMLRCKQYNLKITFQN